MTGGGGVRLRGIPSQDRAVSFATINRDIFRARVTSGGLKSPS
jgi:hypothetical protein